MQERILVIESDQSLREMLSAVLNKEGYLTKTAMNLKEGESELEGRQFDFDLVMVGLFDPKVEKGGIDADSFLDWLNRSRPSCDLLVVTEPPSPENLEKLENHGFRNVASPSDVGKLLKVVRIILSRLMVTN